MEVMVMIGAYAGQIRDIHPFHARGMIERGEALDPNAPMHEAETVKPVAKVPEVVTKVPRVRTERRAT